MFKFIIVLSGILAVVYGQYQRSGWRPSGPPFSLPVRQQLPKPVYGPPPPQEYGPPASPPEIPTTTEIPEISTTTELPSTTTQNATAKLKNNDEKEKLQEPSSDALVQEGVYYIYHPNGLLQRVVYSTKNDIRNMAYTAQLKYQDVEPIKDPIYTYDPATLILQKIVLN